MNSWKAVWLVTGAKYVPWGLASAATMRVCHPGIKLLWLGSEAAAKEWDRLVPDWLRPDFEMRVCTVGEETDQEASRRLKVLARRLVSGNFLQMDADILITRPFEYDFSSVPVLAACLNRETLGGFVEDPSNAWSRAMFEHVKWDWPEHYFNTGFLAWRDCPQAHDFSERWAESRDLFVAGYGKHYDQPAFNKVAGEMSCVTLLDSRYNAPVSTLPQLARRAFCYHYFGSAPQDSSSQCSSLEILSKECFQESKLTRKSIVEFLAKRNAFGGLGAHPLQYKLAGQRRQYIERILRDRWNQIRGK